MPVPAARVLALVCAAVIGPVLTYGCGSQTTADPAAVPMATAVPEDFPSVTGRSLADLEAMLPEGPVLSPTVSVLAPGRNRVGFGLFDTAHKQLGGAQVAVYLSRTDGRGLRGPYPARAESLSVRPQFRSRQTAADPDATKHVYVVDLDFPRAGAWALTAVVRLDGRLVRTASSGVEVTARGAGPPRVGQPAPRVHTPTVADVAGDIARIDTRLPPLRSLHEDDLADVLGREPVVVVFATPQLCQSRVCGPVVDVVAEVASEVGNDARFIHVEIYNDNDVNAGFRPQVKRFRLPTEPWAFVIDRAGVIRTRFEGAFSVRELSHAVARLR